MASYSKRSSGPVQPISSSFQHPTGRFHCSDRMTSAASSFTSSSFASSTSFYSSSPSSPSTGFFHHHQQQRSASPTRVHLHALSPPPPTPSVRFTLDHSMSPRRSIAAAPPRNQAAPQQKRTCLCSPTSHPGSFRCSLHKNSFGVGGSNRSGSAPSSYSPSRLNMRRSAMTNSLVRIGTVEGDLMKRALAALIRPSSHQQRRRADFKPRPSRLSIMSKADDST